METGVRVNLAAAVVLALASIAFAGCHRAVRPVAAAPETHQPSDYVAPPELTSASRQVDGAVVLSGSAAPGAAVRLASPDGSALTSTASAAGVWSIATPTAAAPRLYSLSEGVLGRPVRAKGYIVTLPLQAPAAAMLRPGGGAEPLPGLEPRLRLSGVDFDASGAGVAAGVAPPGETVRLQLDGVDTGAGRANARGVFTVPLAQTLRPGFHTLTATTAKAQARAAFSAAPAAVIPQPPFSATRVDGAWRIDWMTPGGGVQTTLIFDPSEAIV